MTVRTHTRLYDRRGVVLITGLLVRTHDGGRGLITELDPDGYVLVALEGWHGSTAYEPQQVRALVRPGAVA